MISAGSGKGRTQRRTSSFFDDASPMMIDERADREAGQLRNSAYMNKGKGKGRKLM